MKLPESFTIELGDLGRLKGENMAYGYRDLSAKMEEAVRIMKAHGKLVRYDGGFWSWVGVEIHHYRNGADTYDCPIWNCGVRTLRALAKRRIIILDEERGLCQLI